MTGQASQERPPSPRRSPDTLTGSMPTGSVGGGGYKQDHPFFVDTRYELPSGVRVTDDSVSRPAHPLATAMLKNCILQATEAVYAMSLQWKEAARANAKFERERSEFLKEKDKFESSASEALVGLGVLHLRFIHRHPLEVFDFLGFLFGPSPLGIFLFDKGTLELLTAFVSGSIRTPTANTSASSLSLALTSDSLISRPYT
ncbi:hypothetical protein LIER_25203 [Lithospermum erythrorhizon]|uniref:Uncharacterized protein n=1 Tax=Lithospermum erythrorhizon TaxID=34254 RepID=A0AAV3R618_LITER